MRLTHTTPTHPTAVRPRPVLRALALGALLALSPAPLLAQVAGPAYVFVGGTVINADEVNADFAAVYAAALNRTGGVMTGGLTFSPDNANDIGLSGTTRPRDLFLGRNATVGGTLAVTGATTLTGAVTLAGAVGLNNILTVTSSTSPQLLVRYDASNRAEVLVASNGATTINAVGAGQAFSFSDPVSVPAFTSSGAGAISGPWTFTDAAGAVSVSSATPRLIFNESGATANEGRWWFAIDGDCLNLQTLNDAASVAASIYAVCRTGTVVDTFDVGAAQLRVPAGSVATPAFAFTGDPDTGIWNSASDVFAIQTGGTTRMSVSSAGISVLSGSVSTTGGGSLSANGFVFAGSGNLTFGGLGSQANGAIVYCQDCTIASPCGSGGGGAFAKRINSQWVCN